jgi:aquaporin Z
MPTTDTTLAATARRHLPEYLIEAWGIGTFMVSALAFTTLLEHPASPARQSLPDPFVRRALMGLAMGVTGIGLVYSPWGRQSGAHFNPGLTLTFLRLGRVEPRDALGYVAAQLGGALAGVALAWLALGSLLADPAVRFAVTLPGAGAAAAFAAEAAISFVLMLVVLRSSNAPRLMRWTGVLVGGLVALYISFEAPISGMSMNPARSLGSAAGARLFEGLWIYFTAPPLGMLLAAELYRRLRGVPPVRCAKLHHASARPCIFRCGWRVATR